MMITGLEIASPGPSAFRLPEVPFKLSSKTECTNWGAYLNQHIKTKGPELKKNIRPFLISGSNTSYSAVLSLPQPKTTSP
jgi:hypothetical protein